MSVIMYNIIYCSHNQIRSIVCSSLSLTAYIKKFQEDNQKILHIYNLSYCKNRKTTNINKLEINKYYNSKYTAISQKTKNAKIAKEKFTKTVKLLNHLKETCKTKEEFEKEFEKCNKKH